MAQFVPQPPPASIPAFVATASVGATTGAIYGVGVYGTAIYGVVDTTGTIPVFVQENR